MTDGARPVRVFLLDHHEVARRGITGLLEEAGGITVVGEAGTAAGALARVPAVRPDVAVLGRHLPDGDGVSVCRDLRARLPGLNVIILTGSDDDGLTDAILAGASAYLQRTCPARTWSARCAPSPPAARCWTRLRSSRRSRA